MGTRFSLCGAKKAREVLSPCSSENTPAAVTTVDLITRPHHEDEKLHDIGMLPSDMLAMMIVNKGLHPGKNSLFSHTTEKHMNFVHKNLSYLQTPSIATYRGITWTQHVRETTSPSEILPTLFLGSKEDSAEVEKLKKLGITHILSATSGNQHKVPGCKLLTVAMMDNGKSDLADITRRSFPFMNEAMTPGCKLLVHCQLGQNRSPTLVIAWLMETFSCALYNAWKVVKESREMVQPHYLYVEQLRAIDFEMQGVHSTPHNFLALSCTNGEVCIAHEDMTHRESDELKESQRISMTPEEKTLYREKRKRLSQQMSRESSASSYFAKGEVNQALLPDFVHQGSAPSGKESNNQYNDPSKKDLILPDSFGTEISEGCISLHSVESNTATSRDEQKAAVSANISGDTQVDEQVEDGNLQKEA